MGDGVLAYFGWPVAHEDEPERAVRAGLAATAAVARLTAPGGEPLAARAGIATGLVVVGDLIGEGAAQEEAVVGETPNLAARLQALAEPGAVVVAGATRRLLGRLFDFVDLGARDLPGFADPVAAFRVTAARTAESRFEARQSGQLLPMVGRDQELALVLERWRQAAAGEGQAVLLVGEAGIGKSRLVRAVLDALAGEGHAVSRYQCSPHHTSTALWPVAQHLAVAAGLTIGQDEPAKLDRLEALLRQGGDEVGEAVPLIAALLGIEVGGRYPTQELTPQQRRLRTLAALVEQLLGLARRRPVLMVVEDAHWIDPTTLELVRLALDRIADAHVLMLLTSRPDSQPGLGGHPHVTRLTLNRLGRGPTEAIVAHLAGGRGLPPGVLGEIAARTDGVPLFVEELTKAVLEVGAGAGGATAAVPVSLHASLMARLDRVPGVKEVAQAAACIGREFAYPLLAAVSPVPKLELRAALDRLAAAELVFARGEPPDAVYAFKHALVRDAAHESLLRSRRQQLHGAVVQALEQQVPEAVAADLEVLARHCSEAGLIPKAVDYWLKAGQQAVARSAMAEAIAQLTEGLVLLDGLPDDPTQRRQELELQTALGAALIAARGWAADETGKAFARARELCQEVGRAPQLFPVLVGQWSILVNRGEHGRAREVSEELLRLAQRQQDLAAVVTGHRAVGTSLFNLGELHPARMHLQQALALHDPVHHRSLVFRYAHFDPRVAAFSELSWALFALGYPEQAVARSREALTYAQELSHVTTIAVVLHRIGSLYQFYRDRNEVLRWAEELISLATEQGLPAHLARGMILRGWALAAGGDAEAGGRQLREGLAAHQATRARLWEPYFLALLAEVDDHAGCTAERLTLLAEALALVERTGERWFEAELYRRKGEALLALDRERLVEVEACYRRATEIAREQGARVWELRAATSFAHLWACQGKRGEARDLLAPIYGWFTEGFEMSDLREARALLEELN